MIWLFLVGSWLFGYSLRGLAGQIAQHPLAPMTPSTVAGKIPISGLASIRTWMCLADIFPPGPPETPQKPLSRGNVISEKCLQNMRFPPIRNWQPTAYFFLNKQVEAKDKLALLLAPSRSQQFQGSSLGRPDRGGSQGRTRPHDGCRIT